jgi:signal transduction histidine kinase
MTGQANRVRSAPVVEGRSEIQAHTAALEAFVAFTEVSDSEFDVKVLAQQAIRMLSKHFPAARLAYFERDGSGWTPVAWSENVRPDDLTLAAGHVSDVMLKTLPEAQPAVIPAQGTPPPSPFPALSSRPGQSPWSPYPLVVEGQVLALLALELEEHAPSTTLVWAVFRAVGRSLTLALERASSVQKLAQHARHLEESNVLLNSANEELEAFTYGVSHDLRTPLRHITGFAQMLRSALGTEPGEQATRLLGVIEQSASRMNTLIDAMMDLSVASRMPLRKGWVHLDSLLPQARDQAELEGAYTHVRWTVGRLPTVIGDHDSLKLVLINLLSNALKFSRKRRPAHIKVWAEERPQEWAIFIRDDGVGFDPLSQDRLFKMFRRLHKDGEFEGGGVGLTSVRRTITRHGGTVFAQGIPGVGATFGFTLPRGLEAVPVPAGQGAL